MEHDLASQKIADSTGSLHFSVFSFLKNQGDFLGPNFHDLVDDVDKCDLTLRCSDMFVDLGNDGLDALLGEFFLEHFLEDT
jgi:hypothetical protein